jgi:hypothetical protein
MERYSFTLECPTGRCRADASSSDLYVGLFARRYGFVPPGEEVAITEIEYRSAIAAGTRAAIFLLDYDAVWPEQWTDRATGDGEGGRRIEELRLELAQRHEVELFAKAEGLADRVARLSAA